MSIENCLFMTHMLRIDSVLSIERDTHSLWFCISALSDWFKKLAPLSHTIRSKTNRDSLTHVFLRFVPTTYICLEFDWFAGFSVPFLIGESDIFDFGFTTLNSKASNKLICMKTKEIWPLYLYFQFFP